MGVRLWTIVIDANDPPKLGRWWADVLDWQVFFEDDDGDEFVITTKDTRFPGLCFVRVPEEKQVKDRLHIDVVPPADGDQAAEVDRLLGMGATRADVGQKGDEGWVVLADPEGNEFCVLSCRDGGM
jgi:hypothetical protein